MTYRSSLSNTDVDDFDVLGGLRTIVYQQRFEWMTRVTADSCIKSGAAMKAAFVILNNTWPDTNYAAVSRAKFERDTGYTARAISDGLRTLEELGYVVNVNPNKKATAHWRMTMRTAAEKETPASRAHPMRLVAGGGA